MKKRLLMTMTSLLLVSLFSACEGNNSSTTNVKNSSSSSSSSVLSSTEESSSSQNTIDPITEEDFLAVGSIYGEVNMMKDYGTGDVVKLRGTNIGSLFVQENWMTLTNASCQLETINTFTSRFGRAEAYELLSIYEDNFWTDEDFDNCVELGINCIRLPISYMNVWDMDFATIAKSDLTADEIKNLTYTVREDSMEKIDNIIEEAGKRGIYIILDLHGAPGSQNGQDHSGDTGRGDRLWYGSGIGEAFQELTIELWEYLADHYKGNPVIAAYDILNEPAGSVTGNITTSLEWKFFDKLYDAIREIDPDHTIIMESCWDVDQLPRPSVYEWENVMYQYHQYTWSDYNNVEVQFGEMRDKIYRIVNADLGVPILMGEFTMHSNPESWIRCLALLNEYNIHWTTWSYKVKGNSTWGLFNINQANLYTVDIYNDSYDAIVSKWSKQRTNITKNAVVYPVVAEYINGKTTVDL